MSDSDDWRFRPQKINIEELKEEIESDSDKDSFKSMPSRKSIKKPSSKREKSVQRKKNV